VAPEDRAGVRRRRLPLSRGDDEGRAGELRHPGRVVEVEVRHHDDLYVARLEAPAPKLRRDVLSRAHAGAGEGGDEPTEVGDRCRLDRRVEAGVDEDRADRRMVNEEGRAGDPEVLRARGPDPDRLQGFEATAGALEERPRRLYFAGLERL